MLLEGKEVLIAVQEKEAHALFDERKAKGDPSVFLRVILESGVFQDQRIALEALEQYRLGTEELRAGDVDVALNRYLANRCRMVVLYNEYYADPEDPSLGAINEDDYCDD